jgi:hypothetical protein
VMKNEGGKNDPSVEKRGYVVKDQGLLQHDQI